MLDESTCSLPISPHARGSAPLQNPLLIRIVSGEASGAELVVHDAAPSRLYLGRSSSCDLIVPDRAVSRRHAVLELVNGAVILSDLQSKNGTTLRGLPIISAPIRNDDVFQLGSTEICVTTAQAVSTATALSTATRFGRVVGSSREMRRIYPLLERLAAVDVPVLIEGETGTGKEWVAEALHETGARRNGPYVVFDCTTVAPTLVEAALFGHERGAFTGATEARAGIFEQAHGGTLLIDEIGDLDISMQPKLLRALERSEVRRVGGQRAIHVDVRILAATRRDLDAEVQAGRFRDDLFHRLAVVRVELPPLRQRVGDLRILVAALCSDMNANMSVFDESLLARWESQAWPGNVRELRNAVIRRLALGDLEEVMQSAKKIVSNGHNEQPSISALARLDVDHKLSLFQARAKLVDAFEATYLEAMLRECEGNVTRAAKLAGVTRRHFHRLLVKQPMR